MAYIKLISETEADGKLKEIYQNISSKRGKLSNIMKIHSLMPDTMIKHLDLYLSIMFSNSNLSREEKEILAVVVSKLNNCDYCVNHHAEALNYYWKDKNRLKNFIEKLDDSAFGDKFRLAVKYTSKLTTSPSSVLNDDIEELKQIGWTDEDILAINLITSYFNFVNRIALGLGVEFSDDEIKGYKY
ncbi:peroxidase-related enzyme [Ignavibacterium sp.]|uniref:peroxidase-related enzyme n=1 Tax=Ignavibacterium sp. TaxID=2651167 RepID=UPI00307D0162